MGTSSELVSRTENGPVRNKSSIPEENPSGIILGDLGTLYLQWAPTLEKYPRAQVTLMMEPVPSSPCTRSSK